MSRGLVWSLYAVLVVIWSSTWVSIKIGLDDLAPLFGAGIRFALAGAALLAGAVAGVEGKTVVAVVSGGNVAARTASGILTADEG